MMKKKPQKRTVAFHPLPLVRGEVAVIATTRSRNLKARLVLRCWQPQLAVSLIQIKFGGQFLARDSATTADGGN
jgi:hypothetical protein